jgi:sulfate adenylyltransferase subunit 1
MLKCATRTVKAEVASLCSRIDVDTLARQPDPASFHVNDIGHVRLRTAQPLALDRYHDNRATGSFVLIDESNNDTLAAGMVTKL